MQTSVCKLIFLTNLVTGALSCVVPTSSIPNFGFTEPRHINITPGPDTAVNLTCFIDCTGNEAWASSGCSVQPNAIVMVPSDSYAAHKVCNQTRGFRSENYDVSVTCHDEHIDITTFCANRYRVTYNVTLENFSASSPRELVVVCGMAPTSGLQHLPVLEINGLLQRKFIIKVQESDVQVTSDQIDHHPTVHAEEGENVSITCAKTAGTISEWKFLIQQSNAYPLELRYPKNHTQLEEMGIEVFSGPEESSGTGETHDMQNFSILILNVQLNMTGIAIVCGAKENATVGESQVTFYNQATILIVNKDSDVTSCNNTRSEQGRLNAAAQSSVSLGVIGVSAATIIVIVLLFKKPVMNAAANRRRNQRVVPLNPANNAPAGPVNNAPLDPVNNAPPG